MRYDRFLYTTTAILFIVLAYDSKASEELKNEVSTETNLVDGVALDGTMEQSTEPNNEHGTTISDHAITTNDETLTDKASSNGADPTDKSKAKVRMVTREELARHDGKQEKTLWLSIMSQVFDVTAGSEYYGDDAPYQIFSGRDANVPFISGNFTEEEALKPLLELEPHQLSSVDHWRQFYLNEEKYPFIGLLEGELYDKDGNPTEMMKKIDEKLETARIEAEERKRQREELIAKRKLEDQEKKRKAEEYKREKIKKKGMSTLSSILQYFQLTDDKEL